MVPTDLGCITEICRKPFLSSIGASIATKRCAMDELDNFMRKRMFGDFKTAARGLGINHRSPAMRLKAAGMGTPTGEYLNLKELRARRARESMP